MKGLMKTQMKETKEYRSVNRIELHYCAKKGEWFGVYGDVSAVRQAFRQEHSAIAIVDNCSICNYSAAARTAKRVMWENRESGRTIKPIWGVEVDFYSGEDARSAHVVKKDDDLKVHSAVLLAKNKVGLKNINRIISHYLITQESGCIITRSAIEWLREGVIIGASAENGEISAGIASGKTIESLKQTASFYDYLEIAAHYDKLLMSIGIKADRERKVREINRMILRIGDELKIPIVAVNPVVSDCDDQNELIKTSDRMLSEFSYLGDKAHEVVITTPNDIADQIEEMSPIPEGRFYLAIKGAETKIEELCYEKAKDIYGINLPPIVSMRLEHELDIINGGEEASVYLVNREIAVRARKEGNPVAYRGQIGGSLAAFLCGLTKVNPLPPHYVCPKCKRYWEANNIETWNVGPDLPDKVCPDCNISMKKYGFNIPWETLYGIRGDRDSDIDIVVPTDYKDKEKEVVFDVLKGCMSIRAGKIIAAGDASSENADEFMTVMDEYGLFVIPFPMDIEDFTPFQYGYNVDGRKSIITHQDWHNLDIPLLKIDVIGNRSLQILKELVEKTGVGLDDIPLDNDRVLEIFSSYEALGIHNKNYILDGGTYGIPDFDNDLFRDIAECIRPAAVSDLAKCYGLSWGSNTWNDKVRSLIKSEKADIGSIIASREDIYTCLCNKGIPANDAYRIMELARKDRELSEAQIALMKKTNLPDWWIESMQDIKFFSIRSLDVMRTITGIKLAWFKVNYAREFYSSWLTNNEFYNSKSTDLEKISMKSLKQRIIDIRKTDKDKIGIENNDELKTYQVLYEMKARGF